tara:strand:+ start:2035 stop:2649 length:615 start_codon:yes stop_codon:yes gene_type:complete
MANLQDITNRSEVGTIKPWGKATAPAGYVLCDGSAISRSTFADLFAVIGTTYGAGDSSTTFNVPDLQGRFPQGKSGTNSLAGTGGANTVTVSVTNNQAVNSTLANNQSVTITGSIDNTSLTTAQLAAHTHTQGAGGGPGRQGGQSASVSNTGSEGSGTGHNHSHNLSGTLGGTVALTNALTGTVTASGTNSFSPFVVVNYIIKH